MEIFKCAYNKVLPLEEIIPNPKNTNNHPETQINLLSKIINFQGQRSPIVISKRSGFITKGHCRLEAIKKLGWNTAAVDFQEYENEAQEYADMEADNKIAELSEPDNKMFLQNLKEIDLSFWNSVDGDLFGLPDFDLSLLKEIDIDFATELPAKYSFSIVCDTKEQLEEIMTKFKTTKNRVKYNEIANS